MQRDLAELADREFDVVIAGGGIFGVALAWEAASRGLSTALVERGDFCEAASANSFKMVHGGIRYLQHGDVVRVRESCEERSSFLRIAPHIVRPLPIVVPTYGHGIKGKLAMRAAMTIYDLITADRNRGISDPVNHIPRGRTLSRAETVEEFPFLEGASGLTGAALFCDGQMYNPTRLGLSFVRSAAEAGAAVANYVEAKGFLLKDGRVTGLHVRDGASRSDFDIRGRLVLNAAGGWAERLLADVPGAKLDPRPTFSRDACFVVPRRLLSGNRAVAVQGATKDPDALLSRGDRHLFMVPWRDYTLIGVWHVVWKDHPDAVTVPDGHLASWIDEINGAVPGLGLTLDDVSLWNAGLVLFGDNTPGSENLSYGKRSRIIDHAGDGVDGLMTVLGVRYTTARGVAEKTIDQALRKLGRDRTRSTTAHTPIWGGDYDTFDALLGEAMARPQLSADRLTTEKLLRNHGSRYVDLLGHLSADRPANRADLLAAEVRHAVREEMALTLADVVFRRTDLGTGAYPGDDTVQLCGRILAAELGWDAARLSEETEKVRARYARLSAAAASAVS